MKVNNELIREMLLYIEEQTDGETVLQNIPLTGYSKEEINYHLYLLTNGGYIESVEYPIMDKGKNIRPKRLTVKGHMYIDNIRNNNIWLEIKKELSIKQLDLSLDMLYAFCTEYIKSKFNIL